MSDIHYWQKVWFYVVFEKIKKNKKHNFMFLTKHIDIYNKIEFSIPKNCMLGVTYINQTQFLFPSGYKKFISIEPIQKKFELDLLKNFDWVIVGCETGNRKNKIIPELEWIEEIVNYCKNNKIPIFLKNNLKNIWRGNLIQERINL